MIKNIKVNLEAIEAMLYFWQASSEKEKVSEKFINDVAAMPAMTLAYDEDFNAESVRKVLSAVTNRELLSDKNKKEGRFWNNNMWMMEDLEYTNLMVQPLKKLNLQSLLEKINTKIKNPNYEELEVFFSPLHVQDYLIKDNKLIINFFRVKPGDIDDNLYIDGKLIIEYIEEKLEEIFNA